MTGRRSVVGEGGALANVFVYVKDGAGVTGRRFPVPTEPVVIDQQKCWYLPRVVGVRVELPANTPILLLRETTGDRYLPIWIGTVEATAIALEQQGVKPARPLTHDLFLTLFGRLKVSLTRVVITDLRDDIYYAVVHLNGGGGELTLDSRPSDAIALAMRAKAPVLVEDRVFDKGGLEPTRRPHI